MTTRKRRPSRALRGIPGGHAAAAGLVLLLAAGCAVKSPPDAAAIKAAGDRKASPREACQLFNAFVAAQSKMLKYATENATWCGIPNQIMANLKEGIAKTSEVRTKVCQAAAAPQRPAGPSLSDALSGPVPDSNNIKTGRGTFDTLTGSPLGK